MDPGVTAAAGLDQPWASPPSVADVERIIALADPVVRNLQITQCYHELSRALARRTVSHANWCTFAVWASKQAGQTIRKEDLARALEQLWDTFSEVSVVTPSPTSLLRRPVATSVSTARSRSSRRAELFLPDLGWLSRLRWRLISRIGLRNPVDIACSRLVEQARLLGRVVVTEHLLRLSLPGGERLEAGEDLRAVSPAALAHLVNAELLALLDLVDPTPDSLRETAAADWSVLPDRMHFIVDMFRCFQERPDLSRPPFNPEQVATLKDGRRPEGRL